MRSKLTAIDPAVIVALCFLVILPVCPLLTGQSGPRNPTSVLDLFNQEAAASNPAGIHKYSRDVIDLVLPNQWAYGRSPSGRLEAYEKEGLGEDYAAELAGRLARAEQMARTGEDKLVPEANVVRAFNELMREIGAPPTLRASGEEMSKFREHAASRKAFPALLSANRNGTNCNPAEAVFLLYLLISGNRSVTDLYLDSAQALAESGSGRGGGANGGSVRGGLFSDADAKWFLRSYAMNHNRKATVALFNNLTAMLGF